MNRVKVKGAAAVLFLCLPVLSSTGCGGSTPDIVDVETSAIYLTKDGTVTEYLVEEFEKDYYDVAELQQMIQSEIEDYVSQAHAGREMEPDVQLIDICSPTEKNGVLNVSESKPTITVCMEYADAKTYGAYNNCTLYFGKVKEAKLAGYPILTDLYSASGTEILSKDKAQAMGEKHILVFQKNMQVVIPYKALYVTAGVTVEENTVIFDGADGRFAVVIMK